MNNWKENAKIIKRWMRLLEQLYTIEIIEKKDIIKEDYKLNRLKEVIEEYDDIIFWEEE